MVAQERDDVVVDYEDDAAEGTSGWVRARLAIGVVATLAIAHRIYAAEQDMDNARDFDASAIQIVQLWTPHLFYMMAIIGAMIAFYIMSRSATD